MRTKIEFWCGLWEKCSSSKWINSILTVELALNGDAWKRIDGYFLVCFAQFHLPFELSKRFIALIDGALAFRGTTPSLKTFLGNLSINIIQIVVCVKFWMAKIQAGLYSHSIWYWIPRKFSKKNHFWPHHGFLWSYKKFRFLLWTWPTKIHTPSSIHHHQFDVGINKCAVFHCQTKSTHRACSMTHQMMNKKLSFKIVLKTVYSIGNASRFVSFYISSECLWNLSTSITTAKHRKSFSFFRIFLLVFSSSSSLFIHLRVIRDNFCGNTCFLEKNMSTPERKESEDGGKKKTSIDIP